MVPHHIGMPSSNFVLKPMPSSKILRRCSLRCGRFLELVRRHRRACMHCSRINARWNGHPCAERDIPCACTWIGTVGLPIALFLYSYSCGMLHHICMHCNRNHCATAHACGETDILGACTFSATQYVHNLFILWAAKTSRMCILFVDMHSCSEIMQHVAKHPATGNICANVNNMTGHERQRVSYLLTLTNMQRKILEVGIHKNIPRHICYHDWRTMFFKNARKSGLWPVAQNISICQTLPSHDGNTNWIHTLISGGRGVAWQRGNEIWPPVWLVWLVVWVSSLQLLASRNQKGQRITYIYM